MRIWSIHPKYLDAQGLVALWRETLLAQKVLEGKTRGYKNHPQLDRFKIQSRPIAAVATYLVAIADEAEKRGYNFDRSKIANTRTRKKITVTLGQINYEWNHLRIKLESRSPAVLEKIKSVKKPQSHPLFRIAPGEVEVWEKILSKEKK